MHDSVIARQIIEQAKKHGKVKSITIEVGELASLTAHDLEHVMEAMTDCRINVTELPAKVKCACGYTGRPKILERGHDIVMFVCPRCGNVPDVLSGDKITLKKVETLDKKK